MKTRIIDHQKLTDNYFKLILESKEISAKAKAGQFVNILCGETSDPLLRRPFAIHRKDKDKMLFEVLYEVAGKGTQLLSNRKVGEELDVMGPLGNGFQIDPNKKIAILAAGGMGIAPMPLLVEGVLKKAVYVITGHKHQHNLVCVDEIKEHVVEVKICTDDGSAGAKATAAEMLQHILENNIKPSLYGTVEIFACGPKAMLKEIASIAMAKKVDCHVSIEQKMACGVGACLGCSIETVNGYKLVCKDGPVFSSREIKW